MPMPKPHEGEDEQAFVSRFMADEAMRSEYPDEKQRAAVAYGLFRDRKANNAFESMPKHYQCRFIEPGLVAYKDSGPVLVKKDTLDRMADGFRNRPVINAMHKTIPDNLSPEEFEKWFRENADGVIANAYFGPDGWYWADMIVWDAETKKNIEEKNFSVSCAYNITEVGPGGVHNAIPYNEEFLNGVYTHMAIVSNPRYEGARIVYNSKEATGMLKFFSWLKGKDGKDVKNAGEIDEGQTVPVDGQPVSLKELIAVYKAEEAEKAKAKELGLNAKSGITDETIMEIDGKETTVKNMCDSYRAAKARQNAADEEKKKAEEKEKADKEAAERKNAEDKAAKEKDEKEKADKAKADEEAKNAAEKKAADDKEKADKEAKEKEEKERKNQVDEDLKKAAMNRGPAQSSSPNLLSRREQAAEGARKYGSAEKK